MISSIYVNKSNSDESHGEIVLYAAKLYFDKYLSCKHVNAYLFDVYKRTLDTHDFAKLH